MDFALTSDQKLLQDSLTRTLADASPLERVRRFADDLSDKGADVWQAMAEFGLPGIVVPEEYGGLGLTMLDAALCSEALGAAVAPVAFMGVVLAPLALVRGGTEAQRAEWLPKLATGEVLAAVAIFFSTFVAPLVNFFLSGGLYLLGSLFNPFFQTLEQNQGTAPIAKGFAQLVNTLLPNFANYNVQNPIINPTQTIQNETAYYLQVTIYGLFYIGILLVAGILVFDRREV